MIQLTEQEHQELRDKLAGAERFKTFVHAYLDQHGVLHGDPENQHQKEGCRIGARLDLIFTEIRRLRGIIDTTADGVLLFDAKELFCPACGEKCRIGYGWVACDNCGNPDDGCWPHQPPRTWFDSWCYASRASALAAIAAGIEPGKHKPLEGQLVPPPGGGA